MAFKLFADDIRFHQCVLKSAGLYSGPLQGKWTADLDTADQAFGASCTSIRDEIGSFDARSETNILTLMPEAQRAARRFLVRAAKNFPKYSVRIISGTRSYAEQAALYEQGRSKPGRIVTHAKAGESNHNFGIAWDVGIFDGGKYLAGDSAKETRAYRDLAASAMDDEIEWGGNWQSFVDLPHYQMKTGLTLAQIRQRFDAGTPFLLA